LPHLNSDWLHLSGIRLSQVVDNEVSTALAVQVPITVSLVLIGSYLAVGALLFMLWEKDWTYLVGFYFCFITLSTIGFGDYVPGRSVFILLEVLMAVVQSI